MTISRKTLCVLYAFVGLIGLIGTWGNNIEYLDAGILGANAIFWQETFANPASRSITVDILFLGFAAITWMLLEARRLSMPGVWIYVFLSLFLAIAAAFPFFLIHRERVLEKRDGSSIAGTLTAIDITGLAILGGAILVYAVSALSM